MFMFNIYPNRIINPLRMKGICTKSTSTKAHKLNCRITILNVYFIIFNNYNI